VPTKVVRRIKVRNVEEVNTEKAGKRRSKKIERYMVSEKYSFFN
jgi:hypothetical protein